MQDVEPGDWAGDSDPAGTSQQRGVRQILQQLRPGLYCFYVLHKSVGHPGLCQVCAHLHVSISSLVKLQTQD